MKSPRFIVAGQLLERHYRDFDFPAHVPRDPVQFPHRYEEREDVEAVAFIAASLAFGRVAAFEPHLVRICDALGDHLSQTLKAAVGDSPDPEAAEAVRLAASVQYRWLLPDDLRALLLAVGRGLAEWWTLEAGFAKRETASDALAVNVIPGASHNFKQVGSMDEPGFQGEVVPATLNALVDWLGRALPTR